MEVRELLAAFYYGAVFGVLLSMAATKIADVFRMRLKRATKENHQNSIFVVYFEASTDSKLISFSSSGSASREGV